MKRIIRSLLVVLIFVSIFIPNHSHAVTIADLEGQRARCNKEYAKWSQIHYDEQKRVNSYQKKLRQCRKQSCRTFYQNKINTHIWRMNHAREQMDHWAKQTAIVEGQLRNLTYGTGSVPAGRWTTDGWRPDSTPSTGGGGRSTDDDSDKVKLLGR